MLGHAKRAIRWLERALTDVGAGSIPVPPLKLVLEDHCFRFMKGTRQAMDMALELAEQVAKRAITEELDINCCQACGGNPQMTKDYDKLKQQHSRLSQDLKKVMAEHAWMKYQQDAVKLDHSARTFWLQNKVRKQRQALARMYMEVQHLKTELKIGKEVKEDGTE